MDRKRIEQELQGNEQEEKEYLEDDFNRLALANNPAWLGIKIDRLLLLIEYIADTLNLFASEITTKNEAKAK